MAMDLIFFRYTFPPTHFFHVFCHMIHVVHLLHFLLVCLSSSLSCTNCCPFRLALRVSLIFTYQTYQKRKVRLNSSKHKRTSEMLDETTQWPRHMSSNKDHFARFVSVHFNKIVQQWSMYTFLKIEMWNIYIVALGDGRCP